MKDCFDLTGKVALITGASSGLGAQFARALAYRGADVVFMTKYVVPHMIAQNSGRIINISSMYGLRASVTGPIAGYWASKGAIPQLTRGWAWEFAPYNITVNVIAPGFFLTELMPGDEETYAQLTEALIPLKRIARPEEMDGLVTLLASDGASCLTGQTIAIDGGKTAI